MGTLRISAAEAKRLFGDRFAQDMELVGVPKVPLKGSARFDGPTVLEIAIPRPLKKPSTFWGAHWSHKNRERKAWQDAITVACIDSLPATICGALSPVNVRLGQPHGRTRRRVSIYRLTPTARNFLKDDDNLVYAAKPLLDALKQLGLIVDDDRRWLERCGPYQGVSEDGEYWTRIRIEVIT